MGNEEELGWLLRELPQEIMGEVGIRLGDEAEVEAFRSTCKLWRSLVPSPFPSVFSLEIPPPPPCNELPKPSVRYRYCIAQQTGYLLSSTVNSESESESESQLEPVFLVLENKPQGNGFFPLRLFGTGDQCNKKSWSPPRQLDLQRHRRLVLYKAYYLQCLCDSHAPDRGIGDRSRWLQKLILFSYYTDNRSTACNRIPQFAVAEKGVGMAAIAVLTNGDLAHLTINNNNIYNSSLMEWKLVEVDRDSTKFDDIIYCNGRLWGVDLYGGAFVMKDYKSFGMTQIAMSPIILKDGNYYVGNVNNLTPLFSPFYRQPLFKRNNENKRYDDDCGIQGRKRLVEASGTLYMLFPCRRHDHDQTNQIKVYKLVNLEAEAEYKYEWVEVESIGNMAFFVGCGFSFSMEIGTGKGVCFRENQRAENGNCIFLSGVSFCRSDLAKPDYPLFEQMSFIEHTTTGVYSLIDKEFRTISPLDSPQIFCYPRKCDPLRNLYEIYPNANPEVISDYLDSMSSWPNNQRRGFVPANNDQN